LEGRGGDEMRAKEMRGEERRRKQERRGEGRGGEERRGDEMRGEGRRGDGRRGGSSFHLFEDLLQEMPIQRWSSSGPGHCRRYAARNLFWSSLDIRAR
jgi:hypothetical protein